MICCLVEIGMLVVGIITVVKGKFSLSQTRVVQGAWARIIGVILMMPLPVGVLVGFGLAIFKALEVARQGRRFDPADFPRQTAATIELWNVVFFLVLALIVGLATAREPRKPNDFEGQDFGEEDHYPEDFQDGELPPQR